MSPESGSPTPTEYQLAANEAAAQTGEHPGMQRLGKVAMAAIMVPAIAPGMGGVALETANHVTEHSVETTPSTTAHEETARTDLVGNKFQPQFEVDHNDVEVARVQVRDFVSTHPDIFKNPERIVITGLASAEDEGTGIEQLQNPSPANQKLAGDRGLISAIGLIEEVKAQYGVDVSDKLELGLREDNFSDAETAQVAEFASRFGYGSAEELINQYNHEPQNVPPQAAGFFDEQLGKNRGSIVEATGRVVKTIDGKQITTKHTEKLLTGKVIRNVGYIPQEPVVITERPGARFERVRKQDFSSRSGSRGESPAQLRKQPARGNTNVRSFTQSRSHSMHGRKGSSSMRQVGHGGGSGRGHRGR